jgi:hypothetical protein
MSDEEGMTMEELLRYSNNAWKSRIDDNLGTATIIHYEDYVYAVDEFAKEGGRWHLRARYTRRTTIGMKEPF